MTRLLPASRRSLVALALVGALAAGACSRGGDGRISLGVRAIALDLAFAADELAEPIAPEVIIQIIPAPPEIREQVENFLVAPPTGPPVLEPPPVFEFCPTAPEGAAPKSATLVTQTDPPLPGVYNRINKGSFTITGGVLDLTLPFPFFTKDEISEPVEIAPPGPLAPVSGAVGAGGEPEGQEDSGLWEWTTTHVITNEISIATTYRLTTGAIQIVERVSATADGEQVLRPSPPVDLIQLNRGVGHSWRSAGVDTPNSSAIQIEGAIESREVIDVCGELIDTYRVVTNEQFLDLSDGSVSGTIGEDRNVYNIATQYGGIIVSTTQRNTENRREPESGSPYQIRYDYVSTVDSVEPA